MYEIIFNNHLCHSNYGGYSIDNDGRFHSKSNGRFVEKRGRVDPWKMSNEDLTSVNRRDKLVETYNKNHPTNTKTAVGVLDETGKGINAAANTLRNFKLKETKKPRADLSKLTDKELQQILYREEMEQRYDRYFNAPVEHKGQKFVNGLLTALAIAGGVATVAGAAVGIIDKVGDWREGKGHK